MKKTSKKILKSVMKTYAVVGVLLFMAIMSVWEYQTKGYVAFKGGYRVYGEEARTTSWLVLLICLGVLIYQTILFFVRLRTREERERYVEELPKQPHYFICSHCCESFPGAEAEPQPSCPKCGGRKVEELEGYFERHPERKAKCPSISALKKKQIA